MLDRLIYDILKKNKILKDLVKFCYQSIFSILGRRKARLVTNLDVKEISHSFFGFHDRPSMNSINELLSHKMLEDGTFSGVIQILNIETSVVVWETSTECFSKQQASLATWVDDSTVIFNDFNGKPMTFIQNIVTGKKRKLDFHFYSISPGGRYLTSINFLRFGRGLEGYGYDVTYDSDFLADAKNYISSNAISDFIIYDLQNNLELTRFSMKDLLGKSSGLDINGYFYFSHSDFSPSSRYCYFLLRSSNRKFNSSQLFVYDLHLDNLIALDTDGMVSHLSWMSDDSLVAYCKPRGKNDGYYIFHISNLDVIPLINSNLLFDGHPHAYNENGFYTDTYPNRERRQKVFYVDLENNNVENLLELYSPIKFRGVNRVDLHPRLSKCKRFLTIDSSHNNHHSQLVLSVEKIHLQ
ncbi:hypothetical protein VTH8203_01472 [Vibrio thalassae]|uniref:Uncharacterized protein n=1 Tax=Vibrio thalassae TaxID=1243014 RepID=A0A240EGP0_9VIBR|nr:hypothetical protein [Vibrio thalassae]SNX47857.1 hypothetical protein VTH8203_01472 [Vibrio thalassae]